LKKQRQMLKQKLKEANKPKNTQGEIFMSPLFFCHYAESMTPTPELLYSV